MPEGVRGDIGQLPLVLLVVLLHKALNHGIVIDVHPRRSVAFEEQEVGVPVRLDGGFSPVVQYPL